MEVSLSECQKVKWAAGQTVLLWMRRTHCGVAVLDVRWKVRHELRWGGLGQPIADIMTTSAPLHFITIELLVIVMYHLVAEPSASNVLTFSGMHSMLPRLQHRSMLAAPWVASLLPDQAIAWQ